MPFPIDSNSSIAHGSAPYRETPGGGPANFKRYVWIAAALAALFKVVSAATTLGTADVAGLFHFGRMIQLNGLEWLYVNDRLFNHMPLVGMFCSFVHAATQGNPRLFAFFIRLPDIGADLVTILALIPLLSLQNRIARTALMLYALSPVSFMVSGFNGNVDPLMACCLVFAGAACVRNCPLQCAFFYALACNIKSPALLMAPVFLFFWGGRKQGVRFALGATAFTLAGWIWPLAVCPGAFLSHVLGYGSYWGIWGITYWLWLTGWPPFQSIVFYGFSFWQSLVMNLLKTMIIGGVLWIAWRRRNTDGIGIFRTVAAAWIVFMVFSPSVAGQYLVWPAAFLLVALPRWYLWITIATTLHLAIYYTVLCGGFPWYFGFGRPAMNYVWMLSSNTAWAAYLACFGFEARRLFSK